MSELVDKELQEKALAELEKNPAYAPATEEETGITVVEDAPKVEEDPTGDAMTEFAEQDEQKEREEFLAAIAQFRFRETRLMFHQPTAQHSNKLRGVGITRKNKSKNKKARKQEKVSRRNNRRK